MRSRCRLLSPGRFESTSSCVTSESFSHVSRLSLASSCLCFRLSGLGPPPVKRRALFERPLCFMPTIAMSSPQRFGLIRHVKDTTQSITRTPAPQTGFEPVCFQLAFSRLEGERHTEASVSSVGFGPTVFAFGGRRVIHYATTRCVEVRFHLYRLGSVSLSFPIVPVHGVFLFDTRFHEHIAKRSLVTCYGLRGEIRTPDIRFRKATVYPLAYAEICTFTCYLLGFDTQIARGKSPAWLLTTQIYTLLLVQCHRWESNPHVHYRHPILSRARLPLQHDDVVLHSYLQK